MSKFHINEEGNPGLCTAQFKCPFGSEAEHYPTEAAARKAYENRSSSFDTNTLFKKRDRLAHTNFAAYSGFNKEGLTQNMSDFKEALYDIASNINSYRNYRKTGLDEDEYRPNMPNYLKPYLSEASVENAWRREKYDEISSMYTDAIKSYYMENVFDSDDVDVMMSDEEMMYIADHRRFL